MVTDEIENEKFDGIFFSQLFYQYYTEVYPCRIVMVSFLESGQQKGRMVQALESFGINPIQFCLDAKRPDLTRLDKLLGLLCSETNFFLKKAKKVSELIKDLPLKEALKVKLEMERETKKIDPEFIELKSLVIQEEKIEVKKESFVVVNKEDQEDIKKCVICMENDKNIALQCGHLFCSKCLDVLPTNECPTCRQKIVAKIKVYL